jgi:hypothetical protein
MRVGLDLGNLCRELVVGIGKAAQAFDREVDQLVLFALHDERIGRVAREHRVIELGYQLAGRTVPELKRTRHEAARNQVVDQPYIGQHFQRRRMGGRGARRLINRRISLKHPDGNTLPR